MNNVIKKGLIVAAIIGLIILFKVMGWEEYLSLSYLRESQDRFAELYAANGLTVIASYMLIYILVTALSLPGAAIMTLAGGGMFGLLTGTVIVSFASTIGATLACFVSRFLMREWVQSKFADKLQTVNEGIAREGGFYLFSLRLVPVFPFFIINLVMGLTRLPLTRFYLVSQLGMLPGTIVYVNAGKEIAKIDSVSGILSPGLIASFVILGLFPIMVKKIMARVRTRKEK